MQRSVLDLLPTRDQLKTTALYLFNLILPDEFEAMKSRIEQQNPTISEAATATKQSPGMTASDTSLVDSSTFEKRLAKLDITIIPDAICDLSNSERRLLINPLILDQDERYLLNKESLTTFLNQNDADINPFTDEPINTMAYLSQNATARLNRDIDNFLSSFEELEKTKAAFYKHFAVPFDPTKFAINDLEKEKKDYIKNSINKCKTLMDAIASTCGVIKRLKNAYDEKQEQKGTGKKDLGSFELIYKLEKYYNKVRAKRNEIFMSDMQITQLSQSANRLYSSLSKPVSKSAILSEKIISAVQNDTPLSRSADTLRHSTSPAILFPILNASQPKEPSNLRLSSSARFTHS